MHLYDGEIFLAFYAMSLGGRIGAALDGKNWYFVTLIYSGGFGSSSSSQILCVFLFVTTL